MVSPALRPAHYPHTCMLHMFSMYVLNMHRYHGWVTRPLHSILLVPCSLGTILTTLACHLEYPALGCTLQHC